MAIPSWAKSSSGRPVLKGNLVEVWYIYIYIFGGVTYQSGTLKSCLTVALN